MLHLDVSSHIGALSPAMQMMMEPKVELIKPEVFTEPAHLAESRHAEQGAGIERVKFSLVQSCEPLRNRGMAQSMHMVGRERIAPYFSWGTIAATDDSSCQRRARARMSQRSHTATRCPDPGKQQVHLSRCASASA